MPSCAKLSLVSFVLGFLPITNSAQDQNLPIARQFQTIERGQDFAILRRVIETRSANGVAMLQTNGFTVLESGMHYLDDTGNYQEARELVEPFAGGAISRLTAVKAIFAPDVCAAGAVEMFTPGNERILATPLGLAYYDAASGQSVLIGDVKSARGEIVAPNRVVYANFLDGVAADVVFEVRKRGVMQMVVIKENIAPPSAYGLNDETTRLQVLTEFLTTRQPEKRVRALHSEQDPQKRAAMASPDFLDETLLFNQAVMAPGIAFGLNINVDPNVAGETHPVGKQWQQFPGEGRSVLFESSEYRLLKDDLSTLPKPPRSTALRTPSSDRLLPEKRLTARTEEPLEMASVEYRPRGVVLDWEVVTGVNAKTFNTGVTYLISGSLWFGDVYFQPNCIIKFRRNSALNVTTVVGCQGTAASPSILTAVDDNRYGERIPAYGGFAASTGLPSGTYATRAIDLSSNPANTFQHLRIRYAAEGIYIGSAPGLGGQHQVKDTYFEHCTTALSLANWGPSGSVNTPTASNLKDCGVATRTVATGGAVAPSSSVFTIQCNGSADTDDDGLADNWEVSSFGNTTSHNSAGDPDGDGVNNLQESEWVTNPNLADTDADALRDFAEIAGGNFGEADFVDLPGMGANPRHRDIFVEVDYYINVGTANESLQPNAASLTAVENAFALAPIMNPDGTTGINLHFIVDDAINTDASTPHNASHLDLNPMNSEFSALRSIYFTSGREDYFHWALFADSYSGGTSSGFSMGSPSDSFAVTLGPTGWDGSRGAHLVRNVQTESGTIMHELGHNLGLHHGGPPGEVTDFAHAYKPNFFSVMSYNYQLIGLTVDGVGGVLDYSRLAVVNVSEGSLNEVNGFSTVSFADEPDLEAYGVYIRGKGWIDTTDGARANVDFNDNGTIQSGTLSTLNNNTDLNLDGDETDFFYTCVIDWEHLDFDGGQIGEGFEILSTPVSVECTTGE